LSPTEAADEALVMGLRLSEGLDLGAVASRFGLEAIVDWAKIDKLAASGHLTRDRNRIALTPAGRLLLDHILAEISATPPTSAVAAETLVSVAA
jgi:oxygen-independent coproporphyrinogen-3 oxidase